MPPSTCPSGNTRTCHEHSGERLADSTPLRPVARVHLKQCQRPNSHADPPRSASRDQLQIPARDFEQGVPFC